MSKEKRVDVALIGAGTAGLSACSEVRKATDQFVLIQSGPRDSTCARVGCMPSKVLLQVAYDFHRRKALDQEGISGGEHLEVNRRKVLQYVRALRDLSRQVHARRPGFELALCDSNAVADLG